jgi:hypothetical protein
MRFTRNPLTLLPLTPAMFHVLVALADGETHGYAIMKEVERLTDGAEASRLEQTLALARRKALFRSSPPSSAATSAPR